MRIFKEYLKEGFNLPLKIDEAIESLSYTIKNGTEKTIALNLQKLVKEILEEGKIK